MHVFLKMLPSNSFFFLFLSIVSPSLVASPGLTPPILVFFIKFTYNPLTTSHICFLTSSLTVVQAPTSF
ncbi:hypothetical protein AAHE18_05G123700 [Arachis hypogaea]